MPQGNVPNAIPANPDIAAMHAAAGAQAPAAPQVHQGNNLIPGVASPVTVMPEAVAPQRGGQEDWFANFDQPEAAPPSAPPAPQSPQAPQAQPAPDFDDVAALLQDLPQAPPPVQGQPQVPQQPEIPAPQVPPQQQQAPPQAPDYEAIQRQAVDYLMGNEYVIPEADARRLISEPEAVLPRYAAQLHVNVVRDLGRYVAQQLPQMIAMGVQRHLAEHRTEMEFYGRYPSLNRPEFRPVVERAVALARHSNPTGDKETVMREGALLAANILRRGRPQQQPVQRATAAPYQPAAPFGGAPVPQNPNQQSSPWADMANDQDLLNF